MYRKILMEMLYSILKFSLILMEMKTTHKSYNIHVSSMHLSHCVNMSLLIGNKDEF